MKKQQIKAFTLVELIIVITILAILATIGFMSFQSYTSDARDGKRKSDLGELRTGLEVYQAKNAILPNPNNYVTMSGISYQGYAGTNVLSKLRAGDSFQDPTDKKYYTYSTNLTKDKYQLLAMLENNPNATSYNKNMINETYALDYTNRYNYSLGQNVGIYLSGTTKLPVQEGNSGTTINSTGGLTFIASSSSNSGGGGTINDLPTAFIKYDFSTMTGSNFTNLGSDLNNSGIKYGTVNSVVGKIGTGAYIGTSGKISTFNAVNLNNSSYTLMGWFNFTDIASSTRKTIFDHNEGGTNKYLHSYIGDCANGFFYYGQFMSDFGCGNNTAFTTNTWYHIVLVSNKDGADSVYVNGDKKTGNIGIYLGNAILNIGGGIQGPLLGTVDEVYLYKEVLSETQILNYYNSTK